MADSARQTHHDYHLVIPSPWPAIGAVSAFVSALGGSYGCTTSPTLRRSSSASALSASPTR